MKKATSYSCPNCNAPIRWAGEREQGFCDSCGNRVIIEDGKIQIEITKEITKKFVNEARIKEAEAKEKTKLAKIENDKAETKAAAITVAIVFPLLFIFIFVLIFNSERSEERERQQKIEQEQQYIELGKIRVATSADDLKKLNFNSVVASLNGLGFTDIETIPVYDVMTKSDINYNKIESISIAGDYDFRSDDFFFKTDKVVITYHTIEE